MLTKTLSQYAIWSLNIISVMVHQPTSSFSEAQMGEFILEPQKLLEMHETITRIYVQRMDKPLCRI
ncbi:hypothetical protein BT93_A0264 [Corymbia citriodora subsp. variegata]|nr:hypothetical protein BT93_A0264 [Corymbia citriodora subsp. variegata]